MGTCVGTAVGTGVGAWVGTAVGTGVGAAVGAGAGVGVALLCRCSARLGIRTAGATTSPQSEHVPGPVVPSSVSVGLTQW